VDERSENPREGGRCLKCGTAVQPVPTWGTLLWRCRSCGSIFSTDEVFPAGIPTNVWDALWARPGGCG